MLRSARSGASYAFLHEAYYLPDSKMKKYLDLLEVSGLVRYDLREGVYTTTEKGLKFLAGYERLQGMMFSKGVDHSLDDVTDVRLGGGSDGAITP